MTDSLAVVVSYDTLILFTGTVTERSQLIPDKLEKRKQTKPVHQLVTINSKLTYSTEKNGLQTCKATKPKSCTLVTNKPQLSCGSRSKTHTKIGSDDQTDVIINFKPCNIQCPSIKKDRCKTVRPPGELVRAAVQKYVEKIDSK